MSGLELEMGKLNNRVNRRCRLSQLLRHLGLFVTVMLANLSLVPEVLSQGNPACESKLAQSVKQAVPGRPWPPKPALGAPNIVIILLDDAGFGSTSTFGGPAQTPQLTKLAEQGLRYNRFHVTASCSPTRAALLSGRNAHKIGFGTIVESADPNFPGYTGVWKKDSVSVAEVLRRHGYSTAAFGKWHNTPYWEISAVGPFDRWPTGLGFEYFYGFLSGSDSHWEPTLYRNTTQVDPPATPAQGYHLTTDLVDDAIRWVRTQESLAPTRPYFLYFASGALHLPHHVPKEWIDQYRGRFDQGWDQLREETFARQKQLGVIPPDAALASRRRPNVPEWDSLSTGERRLVARQMEVAAAFLAHTDHEIGRLIRTVQEGPRGDNTLIFYIAGDNGAEMVYRLGVDIRGAEDIPTVPDRLRHLDELGTGQFYNTYAAGWGWVGNTPFQYGKGFASHFGGTRTPLIVSWPARIEQPGGLRTQFTNVSDVAATIYEATGIEFPSVVDGVKQQTLDGISFTDSFEHPSAPSRRRTQIFATAGAGPRAIYDDGWVAAALPCRVTGLCQGKEHEGHRWELYHIDSDFSQARDLVVGHRQKLKELQALFDTEARKSKVYPSPAGASLTGSLKDHQPWPTAGRREFIYYSGLPRTYAHYIVPDFSKSHRITAELVIPERGAQGVIVAAGSRQAGFSLYVKDDRLFYETQSFRRRHDVIASAEPVPRGEVIVVYEFIAEAGTSMKFGLGDVAAPGTGRLFINGRLVGERKLGPVITWVWGHGAHAGSLGIGRAFGSPVGAAFQPPFKFTGALEKVTVELE